MSVMISGLALETEIPDPINSGGSTEVMSGRMAAIAALTDGLLAQTHEIRPFSFANAIIESISEVSIASLND